MRLEKYRVSRWIWLLLLVVVFVARAQSPEDVLEATRDTLVYKDGDRVHGQVVSQENGVIVFKSERFGVLRVAAKDAVIIKAEKSAKTEAKEVVAEGIKAPATPAEKKEQEKVSIWDRFSPAVLTAKVRNFFGPWHGRVALSDEVVQDTAHRDDLAVEGRLQRKFEKDAVDLTSRYEYDKVDNIATTDLFKGTGSWRHDFNRRVFSQYRSNFEWNRANLKNGVPANYVLLQQEFGVGLSVLNKPAKTLRIGVSENLFDTWTISPPNTHTSHGVESFFDEAEFALPWRMTLTQRGVWYPESIRHDGWENQVELNKKLTETLSVAIRHEIRRNNPDGTSQDYTKLRLLIGLDF